MIVVHRLFLSTGHNFFGHHDQSASENPIVEVDQIAPSFDELPRSVC